ncbi:hypothetical protein HY994_02820 [Candidatus Micrarchaeota archaeon]|nr:hypothetical protein [Candidatus Micrarchaeota archaeon]
MEPLSKTPKEAYIEGRLLGLSELVSLLNEAMEEDEDHRDAITKSIVQHISNETNSILDDVHGQHPVSAQASLTRQQEALQLSAKKAIQSMDKRPEDAAPQVKKNLEAADELMKKLMALREEEKMPNK